MANFVNLLPGDTAPWFRQRSLGNPNYVFDTAAGRWLVLCFHGSARDEHSRAAIELATARPDVFNDDFASFFAVTADPSDETEKRVRDRYPGIRHFFDFDLRAHRLYGAAPAQTGDAPAPTGPLRRVWVALDPTMRVQKVIPFAPDRSDLAEMNAFLDSLPRPERFAGFPLQAPILVLPNVFEPEFCQMLIGLYEDNGGVESGFMREVDGKTVPVHDHGHKRRKDYMIEDPEVIKQAQNRFIRRVVPQIQKAHQYRVTRMERYIVCCYDAADGAHFRAHRDNTTKGTAHRRFAVSVNLNDDFDGGEVSFPEYGPTGFKAPPGGAVVFSCSLLHAVSKVTRGKRYAFLPFLYDDEAAKIREANNAFLGEGVGAYKA